MARSYHTRTPAHAYKNADGMAQGVSLQDGIVDGLIHTGLREARDENRAKSQTPTDVAIPGRAILGTTPRVRTRTKHPD